MLLLVLALAVVRAGAAAAARTLRVSLQPTSFRGDAGGTPWAIGDHTALPCQIGGSSDALADSWQIGIVVGLTDGTGLKPMAMLFAERFVVVGAEPLPPSAQLLRDDSVAAGGVRVAAVSTSVRRFGTGGVADYGSRYQLPPPWYLFGDEHSSPLPWNETGAYETVVYAGAANGADLASVPERAWREVLAAGELRYNYRGIYRRDMAHTINVACMQTDVVFEVPDDYVPPPPTTTTTTTTTTTVGVTSQNTVHGSPAGSGGGGGGGGSGNAVHTTLRTPSTAAATSVAVVAVAPAPAPGTRANVDAGIGTAPPSEAPLSGSMVAVYVLCGAMLCTCALLVAVSFALHARRRRALDAPRSLESERERSAAGPAAEFALSALRAPNTGGALPAPRDGRLNSQEYGPVILDYGGHGGDDGGITPAPPQAVYDSALAPIDDTQRAPARESVYDGVHSALDAAPAAEAVRYDMLPPTDGHYEAATDVLGRPV